MRRTHVDQISGNRNFLVWAYVTQINRCLRLKTFVIYHVRSKVTVI